MTADQPLKTTPDEELEMQETLLEKPVEATPVPEFCSVDKEETVMGVPTEEVPEGRNVTMWAVEPTVRHYWPACMSTFFCGIFGLLCTLLSCNSKHGKAGAATGCAAATFKTFAICMFAFFAVVMHHTGSFSTAGMDQDQCEYYGGRWAKEDRHHKRNDFITGSRQGALGWGNHMGWEHRFHHEDDEGRHRRHHHFKHFLSKWDPSPEVHTFVMEKLVEDSREDAEVNKLIKMTPEERMVALREDPSLRRKVMKSIKGSWRRVHDFVTAKLQKYAAEHPEDYEMSELIPLSKRERLTIFKGNYKLAERVLVVVGFRTDASKTEATTDAISSDEETCQCPRFYMTHIDPSDGTRRTRYCEKFQAFWAVATVAAFFFFVLFLAIRRHYLKEAVYVHKWVVHQPAYPAEAVVAVPVN